jgi:hypothetical protein
MSWPREGAALWAELAAVPGRLALVVGGNEPAVKLAEVAGETPCRVGQLLTDEPSPPDWSEVSRLLQGWRVLLDLEILFDPALQVDALQLLRSLARAQRGVIAVWPGSVISRRATYSELGRFDRYVSDLSDSLVLRPRQAAFPDETPFTIERIP